MSFLKPKFFYFDKHFKNKTKIKIFYILYTETRHYHNSLVSLNVVSFFPCFSLKFLLIKKNPGYL